MDEQPQDFTPYSQLKNRSFVGLILAQFLAAFNDQAIHFVGIFYASDMLVRYAQLGGLDEKSILSIVTACFIAPFCLFSPLAGILADRFSKRSILVFWKQAEVAMMGLAFVAFLLPHLPNFGWETRSVYILSAILILLSVFLMGLHSSFFVPAKYGVMPEMLHPSVLSRANGILEGTSFMATISGTAFGGLIYGVLKSELSPQGEIIVPGKEWLIGLILFGLAIVGAIAILLVAHVPPANPTLAITLNPIVPLKKNLGVLRTSKPLTLAVVGIAFFAFMTLFLRQSLLFEGETQKDLNSASAWLEQTRRDAAGGLPHAEEPASAAEAELRIALLVALVGLGVGIGATVAGQVSGNKVELGLVPIGGSLLALFNGVLALLFDFLVAKIIILILIGIAAGFYIVPLYTLLQHRAPKNSKGNLVALSNFVNVVGGLIAIVAFLVVTSLLQWIWGINLSGKLVEADPSLLANYVDQLRSQIQIPSLLFLTGSLMTLGMLVVLCRQLPDFFLRTLLWGIAAGRDHVTTIGVNRLPTDGAFILVTDSHHLDDALHVIASIDRFTRFVLPSEYLRNASGVVRLTARLSGMLTLPIEGGIDQPARELAITELKAGNLVAITLDDQATQPATIGLLADLVGHAQGLIPVACRVPNRSATERSARRPVVVFGDPLAADCSLETLQQQLQLLRGVE